MKKLVEEIVKTLVDNPDQVVVEETISEGQAQVKIRVAESDVGQVIGKQGKIVNSIRTIAKAAGTKKDLKVFVEILD